MLDRREHQGLTFGPLEHKVKELLQQQVMSSPRGQEMTSDLPSRADFGLDLPARAAGLLGGAREG